ncbi:TRAP transporter small permease [Xanthobacteraceae bacterium Astr-EGSB]|uniref:TRAP transporter small permease n=1 Tax=Astrobacterium formosum TaxID=3069710 RepID=UPI0027B704E0|nr:TRAP transporter small permease [Xanthobacteraceae bacterium Astr-EGSB]
MLVRLQEVLCTFLFVVMAVVLFLQTIARLFDVSFFWAEELSRYAMVWIIFLGSTVAVYQGSHTNIGVFVEMVPKAIRRYVEALVSLASAAVIGIIAWHGLTVIKVAMMGRSSAVGIPLGYVFGVVTFCGSLMVIFFINRAALKVLGKPLPEDELTEQQKEEVEL